ncbi:tetratricopeptide repeat protein [bacterium]|nr:tetratricopeptide repeat protein [bacterium]MBU1025383.1 tetratricopeptide repeat protein [bacterium]
MGRKLVYIVITLVAFNILAGFNLQRIPRWFKGQWDYYAGKYVSSSQNYEKATAGDTDDVMQYNHGDALYKDGNFEGAEEQFTKAIESNPEFEDAYYNQGNARFKRGNLEGAVESYEKALEIDPEDEDARYNLEYVKKLLEQKNSAGDNADSQDDKHSQDPQSSEKDGQSERNDEPQNQQTGQQTDGQNDEDKVGSASGGQEQESDEQKGGGGGGSGQETEEEQPDEADMSRNTSGLSEQMVEQLLKALAEEEKALAGHMERNRDNQDDSLNDPFDIFDDLFTLPDDLDPFAKQKRKKRDKDEVDW